MDTNSNTNANNNSNENSMFNNYADIVGLNELIDMLHTGRNTALNLLQNQTISNFKLGGKYKIPKKCIVDYINAQIS